MLAKKALNEACGDLCAGRLPIGGGAARGHGIVHASSFVPFDVEEENHVS